MEIVFGPDLQSVPETRWIWQGMLMPGKMTLLTSLWKSGKTTLLAHLLGHRARGRDFLGLATTPGNSVVVSEESKHFWHDRAQDHGLGNEVGLLSRPFDNLPTFAQMNELKDELIEMRSRRGLDLVVIDSLATFLPSRNENNATSMANGLAPLVALAKAGLAVWLLHHPSKGEPALGQAARGSGALLATVDVFLEMRHPGGNPFSHRRKILGWSRFHETPRQMLIELSPDRMTYARLEDAGDDFHTHWQTVCMILAAAGEPLTRQEIRTQWPEGMPKPNSATLWRWLDRAVEMELAGREGNGTKTVPYRYWVR